MSGIASRSIHDTPIAIIDFETTGLTAGADRVVEVAIVRLDPGCEPRLVLDTLVHPQRRVAATEIHGITDGDVAGAPPFSEIAGDVLTGLSDCAVTAYNVYFDMKFLGRELLAVGIDHQPPHFCLMYLRPQLGLGPRCKLDVACRAHGVEHASTHMAAADALASARLLQRYLREAESLGVRTFEELGQRKKYKFVDSFWNSPLPSPARYNLAPCSRLKSRGQSAVDPERVALAAYWDTLKTVVGDLDLSDEEVVLVEEERQRLGLSLDLVRSLHARIFGAVISQFTADKRIDDKEARRLARLHQCLSRLGWAPGE